MKCLLCNKRVNKNNKYCKLCKRKIPYVVKCKVCNNDTLSNLDRKLVIDKKGLMCPNCHALQASIRFKKYKNSLTPEQRSLQGKIGSSAVKDKSHNVRKQWETIKSNPILNERSNKRLKELAISNWKNYTDEKRNEIISKWLTKKSRSKICDKMKQMMIDFKIEGFESEKMFHGFCPDEINFADKIIVEFYGDLYHCNPRKYKDSNQYIKAIGRTVEEQWKRDRKRLACFYKHGYTVIIIWEKDFRIDPKKQIQRIKDEIIKKRAS